MSKMTEITASTFDQEVRQSPTPVVVDFWAPWCGPCRMVAPVLERMAGEREGSVRFVKMNIDDNMELSQELGIRTIPSIWIFRGGRVVAQVSGAVPKAHLDKVLDQALAKGS